MTLKELDNVGDFVQKLELIEPPNQLVAVISNPFLQKYLQLRSSEKYKTRIDSWLLAFFEDRLSDPEDNASQIISMLDSMVEYTRYTKVCHTQEVWHVLMLGRIFQMHVRRILDLYCHLGTE